MEGGQEAPEDYERFSANGLWRREKARERSGRARRRHRRAHDEGRGGHAEATWGLGEKRQRKKAALAGRDTVDAKPAVARGPAALLIEPAAAPRAGSSRGQDESPRAPQGRRRASLVRTKPAAMERIKPTQSAGSAARTNLGRLARCALGLWNVAPKRCKPWKRVTSALDLIPVVSSRWTAANALCPEGSRGGKPWVQAKLTARLRGRVGDVIGGLAAPTRGRLRNVGTGDARARHHLLPEPPALEADDAYLAMGLPSEPASWSRRAVPS